MTEEQLEREEFYQASMNMFLAILKKGLITREQYPIIDTKMREKYRFEKESIDSLSGDGEVILTLLASFAQEESHSISENCTWWQRKRMSDGKVSVAYSRFLGYDQGPDGRMVVNPEEAVVVCDIYDMFLLGLPYWHSKETHRERNQNTRREILMGRIIVVGSGFSWSILARRIAEECGRNVEVIEKRPHIGGNMYDEYDAHGILVQRYGPHFLNTNKYWIVRYVSQFAEWFPHNPKLLSYLDGRYIRLPYNFESMQQLIGPEKAETVIHKLRKEFPGRDRVPILELVDHADPDISEYGTFLFEKAFRTYTSKMWGIDLNKIDKYVLERTPMALGYDERYLNKDFQYLPKNGYCEVFQNMLNHPGISVQLNTDALEHLELRETTRTVLYDGESVDLLVFTGQIDELFHNKYGSLPYRSLDIRFEYSEQSSVLPAEIISYPQAEGKTRSAEYRKIMFDDRNARGSVVATEYPLWYDPSAECGNTPYYPVVTDESNQIYEKYVAEAAQYGNIFLCGRLAEFKYYNMDICIEHAFEKFEEIKRNLK